MTMPAQTKQLGETDWPSQFSTMVVMAVATWSTSIALLIMTAVASWSVARNYAAVFLCQSASMSLGSQLDLGDDCVPPWLC